MSGSVENIHKQSESAHPERIHHEDDHTYRNLDLYQAAAHSGNTENSVYLLDVARLY